MIHWHRIKLRVSPDAWFNRPGAGLIVVVDCGKGLAPAIDSLVDVITEGEDGGRIGTYRVRGVERGGGGTKVGLVVTKATDEEKAEAYGATTPPWKAVSDGMPTDRDVWAYVMEWEGDEVVSLLRGRRQGSEFLLAGEDWAYHQVENVIAGSMSRSARCSRSPS